jgi:hypothetical protein
MKLALLRDDFKIRMKLLLYENVSRKHRLTLAKNNTLTQLADKIRLDIDERMRFIRQLPLIA